MTHSNNLLKATDGQKTENELADLFVTAMRKEAKEYGAAFVSFNGDFEQAIRKAKEVETNIEEYADTSEEEKPRKPRKPVQASSPAPTMKSTVQSISTVSKVKDKTLARMEELERKTAQSLAAIQAVVQQSQSNQSRPPTPPQSQRTTQANDGNAKKGGCNYCDIPGHFEDRCRKKRWDSQNKELGKGASRQWIERWCNRYSAL